jgi:hypothetical protein
MLDLMFTIGQTASALLLVYGAYLVLMPARKQVMPAALPKQEMMLAKS